MEPQTILDIAIRGACIWQVLCFLFVLLRAGFRVAAFSSSSSSSASRLPFPHLRLHLLPLPLPLPLPTVLHPVAGVKERLSLITLPPEAEAQQSSCGVSLQHETSSQPLPPPLPHLSDNCHHHACTTDSNYPDQQQQQEEHQEETYSTRPPRPRPPRIGMMRSPRSSFESLNTPPNARGMQTPHKPPSRMMHLPTPPPSFQSDTGDSETPDRTPLWTCSSTRSEDSRLSPTPLRMAPPTEQESSRRLRLSMSPEPDFPRLLPPGSARATPDRDTGRDTRESSPAVGAGRTSSPDPCDGDRSRSNSPEATLRPPPLRPLTEQNLNAKHHYRKGSTGARSVMSAYDMITSYIGSDGQHAHTKRQQTKYGGFQPNAGLSKPITPSFIRDYNSGATPSPRARNSRDLSPDADDEGDDGSSSRIFGGSLLLSNTYGGSDGTATSQSGDILRMSELSRQRQAMGWNYAPLPESRIRHDISPSNVSLTPSEPEESLSTVYYKEFSSQLDTFARSLKKPVVTFVLIMIIPIILSLGTSIITASRSSPSSNNTNTTFGGNIDFPTLMSIEASFERVVDSAAGGSELARSLKQSEMAVADLSAVVKYSDLNCRETLSTRLEQFAIDARDNVIGLLEFSAKVGGVLDELLSVNQYALRELNALQTLRLESPGAGSFLTRLPLPWPLSSLFPSTETTAKTRLSQTFDTAVEVLETNLRLLIAHGTIIQAGLMGLSQQNGPIRTEIVREFADIRRGEAEAMSSLWARISSPSAKRQNFKDNERLLREINVYHDKARGYVEVTLLELGRMTSELDNLRRRVAQPLLVERKVNIGMEIGMQDQVAAIQGSVEALLRKRGEREERQRIWNRIILEGSMKGASSGGRGGDMVEGPRF